MELMSVSSKCSSSFAAPHAHITMCSVPEASRPGFDLCACVCPHAEIRLFFFEKSAEISLFKSLCPVKNKRTLSVVYPYRHEFQILTLTFYFYKNIYQKTVYIYIYL
jgi:hypothetical protein